MFDYILSDSVNTFLLSIICFIFVLISFNYHWGRRHLYLFSLKSHGPPAWPMIGHFFRFAGKSRHAMVLELDKIYSEKSPSVLWVGSKPHYVAKTPEEYAIIFNSPKVLLKSTAYKFLQYLLGDGLFSTFDIKKWRAHRRIIARTMSQSHLNDYSYVFQKHAEKLVNHFEKNVGKGVIDIYETIMEYTAALINETAMGLPDGQTEQEDEFAQLNEKLKPQMERMMLIGNIDYLSHIFFRIEGSILETIAKIRQYCSKVISYKRNEKRNKNGEIAYEDSTNRKSFLDLILDSNDNGVKFTDTECIDEVMTFTIAGSDTSGFVASGAILMLGMHPTLQEQIYEEVKLVCGDGPITKDVISELKLLERFIKETMRLFPVAICMGRYCSEDLDLGSFVLPKGMNIAISFYAYHRNPKYWPDPLKFDPDRFLPEEIEKRHPYAYVPFSSGPRNCLGYKYAMLQLRMTIASLVRSFKFKTPLKQVSDVKFGMQIITKCETGFPVEIYKRLS